MAIDTVTICYDDGVSGSEVCQTAISLNFPEETFVSHSWDLVDGATVNLTNRVGFQFTVTGGDNSTVNQLAFYHPIGNNETENVRIHRTSDGVLMAEADFICASAATYDQWLTETISDVVLVNGVRYVISHRAGGAPRALYRNPYYMTIYSRITSLSHVFGSDDNQPTTASAQTYFAARFGYAI